MVVVGGGLAGLVAARDLARSGAATLVLEARARVGGRTLDEPIADDTVAELGASWVGPSQDAILGLAGSLGVDTYPSYDTGDAVLELDGNLGARSGGPRPWTATGLALDLVRQRLDHMARCVPREAPWTAPKASRWDSQTLASWLRGRLPTSAARRLMRLDILAVWGAEPAELSLLDVLFGIRSAGGFDAMISVAGGAQQDRLAGGPQSLSLKLAESLGERVLTSSPVRRIEDAGSHLTVVADSVVVDAKRAVIAVPPSLAGRISYAPPLPGGRDQLTQRMAMAAVIKVAAVYSEPFWREDGLSGRAISDRGPVVETADGTPVGGAPGVLLAFVAGQYARVLGRLSSEQRRESILACLVRWFGTRGGRPERYLEVDWAAEEWTRGAYGAYFPPGGWTGHGRFLREPIGRLHWAGTETATEWVGYMDGAVRSGGRAAVEALERSR